MTLSNGSKCASALVIGLLAVGQVAPLRGQSPFDSRSESLAQAKGWWSEGALQATVQSVGNGARLNHYLSYGSIIGVAGGLAWGVITEHRQTRVLDIAGDAAIGWVVGMAGGAVAYMVHEARHR